MAYVPKDWVTGEVITESALDHIEQGIANASNVLVLHYSDDSDTDEIVCDHTQEDIMYAVESGTWICAMYYDDFYVMTDYRANPTNFTFKFESESVTSDGVVVTFNVKTITHTQSSITHSSGNYRVSVASQ